MMSLPVCSVAQDGDDRTSPPLLLGQLGRGNDVQGRRRAYIQPFLVQESVNHIDGC